MTDPMQAIDAAVASVTDPSDSAQIAAALRSVSPALVDDVIFGVASSTVGSTADGVLLGVGLAASPGVGVGQIAIDPAAALDAWERGTEVVLLVDETRPEDEPAMRVASAIVCRAVGWRATLRSSPASGACPPCAVSASSTSPRAIECWSTARPARFAASTT
ncbi:MAG: hypothetical protein V9G12_06880 [Microthrixaceae bacterium]